MQQLSIDHDFEVDPCVLFTKTRWDIITDQAYADKQEGKHQIACKEIRAVRNIVESKNQAMYLLMYIPSVSSIAPNNIYVVCNNVNIAIRRYCLHWPVWHVVPWIRVKRMACNIWTFNMVH